MKTVSIQQYLGLRNSLLREKETIENRLQEIERALDTATPETPLRPATSAAAAVSQPRVARRGRRAALSLKSAVMQVISSHPRTKEKILEGVKQLGYRFTTLNPLNSLGVILYGKSPKFRNEGGCFSYHGPQPEAKSGPAESPAAAKKQPRRKLSAEALARMAAAQRARWAKVRAAKSVR